MKKKHVLSLILVLGLVLRIYKLGYLEPFGDELDVGYHAYSLWKTGRDYRGQLLPTYIHSFSEWRAPLLMYVTAPFVGLFGLSAWTIRLPIVLVGITNIFLLYKLIIKLTKSKRLGLAAALLLSIMPWHIHYSRTAFEATLLLSLILGGTISFLNSTFIISAVLFGLSFYAYNTANVFVPLIGLVLFWLKKEELTKKWRSLILPGLFLILISLPIIIQVFSGQASERFSLISIFNDQATIGKIIHFRNTGLNPKIERIFHNKLVGWGSVFIDNYLTSFSPQFLFLHGDPNPRHSLPNWGQFYWILSPFLILGIIKLVQIQNSKLQTLVLSWLLISPVPAALTVGGGNQATRLFLMLPPVIVLIALGISKLKNNILLITVYLLLFTFLFFFLHNYFVHYEQESYEHWHYGYREAMTWLAENRGDEKVLINNTAEPALVRYLFWNEINPAWFQNNFSGDQIQEETISGFNGFKLENTYFGYINEEERINWLKTNLQKGDLYLAFQGKEVPGDWDWELSPPEGLKVLKAIDDPWGNPLMYWVAADAAN